MKFAKARGTAFALAVTARPRQWIKNLVPLAVPVAGAQIGSPAIMGRTVLMVMSLCLASASTYLVNDAHDAALDCMHPTKRFRPVAAGKLSRRTAACVGLLVGLLALVISTPLGPRASAVLLGYLFNSLLYTYLLKQIPILDVLTIASGFLLRAIAGGVVSGVEISPWFLLVTVFGSLFLAFGKRFGELKEMGSKSPNHRLTLELYDSAFLQQMLTFSQTGVSIAFCLWAIQYPTNGRSFSPVSLSIGPFLFVVMRLSMLLMSGKGTDPAELFYLDRILQLGTLVLCAVLVGSIYL